MSTRAVYTFIEPGVAHHVYKHYDGYPSGACEWIKAALPRAWTLPRFEADEFAAAFVAANKDCAGGVRLTHGYADHGDLEYRYEITVLAGELSIKAFTIHSSLRADTWSEIYSGSLSGFEKFAKSYEA